MEKSDEHILAARDTDRVTAENRYLPRLIDDMQRNENDAHQQLQLLNAIVDLLPVGVMVETGDGRTVLVNDCAAAQLGVSAQSLIGPSLTAIPPNGEVIGRRRHDIGLTHPGNPVSTLETIAGPDAERTLLTSRRTADVRGETLRLSCSVDISEHRHR